MTSRNTWKQLERRVARHLNTERTPLSGGNSRITESDTLSDKYYCEVKLRKRIPAYKLFNDTQNKAKKEGKRPIVVLHEKNSKRNLVLLDLDDFIEIEEVATVPSP